MILLENIAFMIDWLVLRVLCLIIRIPRVIWVQWCAIDTAPIGTTPMFPIVAMVAQYLKVKGIVD